MKPVLVGTYELGYEWVRVYLREGTGANFDVFPADKGNSKILIGADRTSWSDIIRSTLHEVFEMLFDRNGCTYRRYLDDSQETGNFTFIVTHQQHATICHDAARFLVDVLPALGKAWKGWKRA